MIKTILVLMSLMLSLLTVTACTHVVTAPPPSPETQEKRELAAAQDLLDQGNFHEALASFNAFQKRHPQSHFYQAADLGQAEAWAGLAHWTEAATLYRNVYLRTVKDEPAIAAKAVYELSFAYEALGDDLKTVGTLLDAKKMKTYLPPAVALAEIPARLAMIYGKADQEAPSLAYLKEADQGLDQVIKMKYADLDKSWLAKTYFQMGSVSTNQLSVETFAAFARGQKAVQVYLIRDLQLQDPVWSQKALLHLKATYSELFSTMLDIPLAAGIESSVALRMKKEQQVELGSELVDLINQAELYKPLASQGMNSLQGDFYSYLNEIRKSTEKLLYSGGEGLGLTRESLELNGLKRRGHIKDVPTLPVKIVPSEDPNL